MRANAIANCCSLTLFICEYFNSLTINYEHYISAYIVDVWLIINDNYDNNVSQFDNVHTYPNASPIYNTETQRKF